MSAVLNDKQPTRPLVSLRNLNKHYGDFAAVDDISLDIQDGEFLTFLLAIRKRSAAERDKQVDAMRLSQRIAIFSHGKIVGLGSGYDLYQNPPNAFVASFLGNSNFLRIKAHGNGAASFEGQPLAMRLTPGLAEGQEVLLMVRPEKALALSVEQAAREALPAGWNEVTAKVGEVLFLGESQTCSVLTAGGTAMTVKALSAAGMPMQPGDTVKVRWAVADACVYTQWAESDLNKAAGAH
ncbi:TOBE domain-containing protein [Pseudomonas sp. SBB6]|uniref:TOBE domain-containing protein n=1 Tax=Pseudomonas sp. SBB6 TaxID=2962032 RepID=UPI0020B7B691|nr:TOBE domain-containing protein [Pseudomonas sp. SBB6]MCP3751414.1 TOBE domain-containing protein [Pseudomonas sp. SBB6]